MADLKNDQIEKELQVHNKSFEGWQKRIGFFLVSQFISLFGSSIVSFAIIWHVTLTTKSGSAVMLMTLFTFIPQILVTLFAGVWADRYNRKRIIVLSDALVAASTLILALFYMGGFRSLWLFYLLSAIRSLGSGIQSPAVSAMIPQIVPKNHLARINGIFGSIYALTTLISPAVAGVLMGMGSLIYVLFLDVITAVLAITLVIFLKIKSHEKALDTQQNSQWQDFKAGLRYVGQHKIILSLLVFFALLIFSIVPAAMLSPLLVARTYGSEVWKLTANEMAFSGGSLLGGGLVALWPGFKRRHLTLAISTFGFGLFTIVLGIAHSFAMFLGAMFFMGIMLPYFNATTMATIQERVEEDYQGRVFSFINIVTSSAFPVGMMVFGPLSDQVSLEGIMIVTGLAMLVQGVGALLVPSLKSTAPVIPVKES